MKSVVSYSKTSKQSLASAADEIHGGDFSRIQCSDTNLSGLIMVESDLTGASFYRCNLIEAMFDECILEKASFVSCVLNRALFDTCRIQDLKFSSCSMQGCTVSDPIAFVNGARAIDCDVTNMVGLNRTKEDGNKILESSCIIHPIVRDSGFAGKKVPTTVSKQSSIEDLYYESHRVHKSYPVSNYKNGIHSNTSSYTSAPIPKRAYLYVSDPEAFPEF